MKHAKKSHQYQFFKRKDFLFAVETKRILAIKDDTTILRVPDMPDYLLGFINLQRDRAAIIDISNFYCTSNPQLPPNPLTIIMETDSAAETGLFFGVIADCFIEDTDHCFFTMQPVPSNGTKNYSPASPEQERLRFNTEINFEELLSERDQEKIWACSEWFGSASQSNFLWTREICKFSKNFSH